MRKRPESIPIISLLFVMLALAEVSILIPFITSGNPMELEETMGEFENIDEFNILLNAQIVFIVFLFSMSLVIYYGIRWSREVAIGVMGISIIIHTYELIHVFVPGHIIGICAATTMLYFLFEPDTIEFIKKIQSKMNS